MRAGLHQARAQRHRLAVFAGAGRNPDAIQGVSGILAVKCSAVVVRSPGYTYSQALLAILTQCKVRQVLLMWGLPLSHESCWQFLR